MLFFVKGYCILFGGKIKLSADIYRMRK